jgi:hypothetical protein
LTDISGHHIFTDQFYYSPSLASELSKVMCHLTGNWKDVAAFTEKNTNEKVKIQLTEIMKTFYCCPGN